MKIARPAHKKQDPACPLKASLGLTLFTFSKQVLSNARGFVMKGLKLVVIE